jgi:hypothetical protein
VHGLRLRRRLHLLRLLLLRLLLKRLLPKVLLPSCHALLLGVASGAAARLLMLLLLLLLLLLSSHSRSRSSRSSRSGCVLLVMLLLGVRELLLLLGELRVILLPLLLHVRGATRRKIDAYSVGKLDDFRTRGVVSM